MRHLASGALVLILCVVSIAEGQTPTYTPLGLWGDPATHAYADWNKELQRCNALTKPNRESPAAAISPEPGARASEAANKHKRESYAAYMSLDTALTATLKPANYAHADDARLARIVARQSIRATRAIITRAGIRVPLKQLNRNVFRGLTRGGPAVSTALAVIEIAWLLGEPNWQHGTYRPEFYAHVAGAVGATVVSVTVTAYVTVLAAPTGVFAPLIGLSAGVAAGTVSYFCSKAIVEALISVISPEMRRYEERQHIKAVQASLDRQITSLQKLKDR
jgi:hypothetical protein